MDVDLLVNKRGFIWPKPGCKVQWVHSDIDRSFFPETEVAMYSCFSPVDGDIVSDETARYWVVGSRLGLPQNPLNNGKINIGHRKSCEKMNFMLWGL